MKNRGNVVSLPQKVVRHHENVNKNSFEGLSEGQIEVSVARTGHQNCCRIIEPIRQRRRTVPP
jgi:hypothetical protein